ncbi:hypothetical protein HYC85_005825 [Camellia sinensis]|uniref:OTU domain-containing protein n=1 Tax=Camellia sinensis TaxID=4442 RepID=A0A7J7I0K8_CAMSI|nr:hypothetical protein HYC85_005825 [Camellia sinensis]
MRNETQSVGESSSSTSLSSQQDVDDDRMIAVVLSEEYASLDGAVGRRLSNLAPVPVSIGKSSLIPLGEVQCVEALVDILGCKVELVFHLVLFQGEGALEFGGLTDFRNALQVLLKFQHIPRINSFIPNVNDASLDHQRLLQRLNVYGLYEVKVSGDGNCQFRALSEQMYKSPEYHKHVRKEVVKQVVIKVVFNWLKDFSNGAFCGGRIAFEPLTPALLYVTPPK